jgi:hypothetical protein
MPDTIRVPQAGVLLITLPSDSTSQWTPLRLANGWQLPAPIADFHRQVTRHAWRTIKRKRGFIATFSRICLSYVWIKVAQSVSCVFRASGGWISIFSAEQ